VAHAQRPPGPPTPAQLATAGGRAIVPRPPSHLSRHQQCHCQPTRKTQGQSWNRATWQPGFDAAGRVASEGCGVEATRSAESPIATPCQVKASGRGCAGGRWTGMQWWRGPTAHQQPPLSCVAAVKLERQWVTTGPRCGPAAGRGEPAGGSDHSTCTTDQREAMAGRSTIRPSPPPPPPPHSPPLSMAHCRASPAPLAADPREEGCLRRSPISIHRQPWRTNPVPLVPDGLRNKVGEVTELLVHFSKRVHITTGSR